MARMEGRRPVSRRPAVRGWTARGLVVAASLLWGVPARAADASQVLARLRVLPGATCLRAEAIAAQTEQWLQGIALADDFVIVVQGSAVDPRRAQLRVERTGRVVAHRSFDPGPARCGHLHAAVGLAVGLAIKASLVEELAQPLPDDPSVRGLGLTAAVSALGLRRVLPGTSAGLQLLAGHGLGRFARVRLGVLGTVQGAVALPRDVGAFDVAVAAVRADACLRGRLATLWHGALCMGAVGGVLRARGARVAESRAASVGYAAVTNGAELELEVARRWSLSLELSAVFLLHDVEIGLRSDAGERVASRWLDRVGFALGLGPVYLF